MFSQKEKQEIADKIEKILLDMKHPEMPTSHPMFTLHVDGKESWSWADIKPNWTFVSNPPIVNPWNEVSRKKLKWTYSVPEEELSAFYACWKMWRESDKTINAKIRVIKKMRETTSYQSLKLAKELVELWEYADA